MKRSAMPRSASQLARTGFKRKERADWPDAAVRDARASLRRQAVEELVAWSKAVKERDGWRCQWPDCDFCYNLSHNECFGLMLEVSLTAHHKALRSARPDLRLVLENGVTVCWSRHSWIHTPAGHDEAVRLGFLNLETFEAAAKEQRDKERMAGNTSCPGGETEFSDGARRGAAGQGSTQTPGVD